MKIIKPNIIVSLTEFPDSETSGIYFNSLFIYNFTHILTFYFYIYRQKVIIEM